MPRLSSQVPLITSGSKKARDGKTRVLAGLIVVGVVVSGFVIASGHAAVIAPMNAAGAQRFLNSIGVVAHLSYPDYSNASGIATRLDELNVLHVRSNVPPGTNRLNDAAVAALRPLGVRFDWTIGAPEDGLTDMDNRLNNIAAHFADVTDSIEGTNEYDLNYATHSGWNTRLAAYQDQLFRKVAASSVLQAIPVIGPSLIGFQAPVTAPLLGDQSAHLTYGNIHSYAGDRAGEDTIQPRIDASRVVAGLTKPLVATETGYTNHNAGTNPPYEITEKGAGYYTPRTYLDYFSRGILRTYNYELVDEPSKGQDDEKHYGLLHNDLSYKPAATQLRNLTSILADTGSSGTGSLRVGFGGDQVNLKHVLLHKSDGSFWLALWRDESVYDRASTSDIGISTRNVTLNFGESITRAERYAVDAVNVSAALTAQAAQSNPTSYVVPVGQAVVIVKLQAATSTPSATPVVTSTPTSTPGTPTATPVLPSPTVVPTTPSPLPTATPSPVRRGDITGQSGSPDGRVDLLDLSYMALHWGSSDARADLTGPTGIADGIVNVLDLSLLLSGWTG